MSQQQSDFLAKKKSHIDPRPFALANMFESNSTNNILYVRKLVCSNLIQIGIM